MPYDSLLYHPKGLYSCLGKRLATHSFEGEAEMAQLENQCEGYSPEDTQREIEVAREESERQQALDILMTGITHCLDCTREMFIADGQAGFLWDLCSAHRERMRALVTRYPDLF
jgi:hypothetical protein